MESLRELKAKIDETYKTMAELGKGLIKEEFQKLFEEWPEIAAIRWRQYTPYWNDGEPCTFRVCSPYVKINDFGGDADDGWLEEYDFEEGPKRDWMRHLEGTLEAGEIVLKSIFGDHVQVTVWRDKDEAEVEEYEHD